MTNPSIKKPGFYASCSINHLEESAILFQQLPFLIGFVHSLPMEQLYSLVLQCTSTDFLDTLQQGLQSDISFEQLVDTLNNKIDRHQLFDLAKHINQFDVFSVTELTRADIIHLGDNHITTSCLEPDESSIQDMVNRFLEAMYANGKLYTIIKHLLLKDVIDLLSSIVQNIEQITHEKGYRNSLFKLTLRQLERFVKESFVLSFNGSRYDLPLIINHIYQYQIDSKRCKIKTFRKGSVYSSVTVTWTKSKTQWSQQFTFKDVRNLTEQNCSLDLLSRRYGVDTAHGKGTFPHSANSSVKWLKTTEHLPNYSSDDWFDILRNKKPSQEDVQQANHDFQMMEATNLYDYMLFYLKVCSRFNLFFIPYIFIINLFYFISRRMSCYSISPFGKYFNPSTQGMQLI
jgi:hypothetical protein